MEKFRLSTVQWDMSPSMHEMCSMQQVCSLTPPCHSHSHSHCLLLLHTCTFRRPRSVLSLLKCSGPISASSIASISASQVGGWRPLPSTHLVRPACTAASSSRGLLLKHASIVAASSHTPSRTALPLPAATLLTFFLKSMRWFGRSAEIYRKTHHAHTQYSIPHK